MVKLILLALLVSLMGIFSATTLVAQTPTDGVREENTFDLFSGEGGDSAFHIPNPYGCKGSHSAVHNSVDVPGTIDATQTTRCPFIITPEVIGAAITIYKEKCFWIIRCWWTVWSASGDKTREDENRVKAITARNCEEGKYKSRAEGWFYYNGHYYGGSDESGARRLYC